MPQKRKAVSNINKSENKDLRKPCNTGKGRLLEYHDIPSWQQENEFILTGYRPTSGSVRLSLETLLYMNNETGMHST